MIVLKPTDVTDSEFISSNVLSNDYAEWAANTTYSVGTKRTVETVEPDIHRNYEALTSNRGVKPWLDDGSTWLDLGATNRWAMFDLVNGSITENATKIEINLSQNGIISGIALLNIKATTASVEITDSAGVVVFDKKSQLTDNGEINNWFKYYFNRGSSKDSVLFLDFPIYSTATMKITLESAVGKVSCGVCVVGIKTDIGVTTYGTSTGIIDYSLKSQDSFGNFTITKRGFSKRSDYFIEILSSQVSTIQRYLSSIRSTPVVWVGSKEDIFDSTIVYGYYRDFDLLLTGPVVSDLNLTVEGLT